MEEASGCVVEEEEEDELLCSDVGCCFVVVCWMFVCEYARTVWEKVLGKKRKREESQTSFAIKSYRRGNVALFVDLEGLQQFRGVTVPGKDVAPCLYIYRCVCACIYVGGLCICAHVFIRALSLSPMYLPRALVGRQLFDTCAPD